MNVRTKLIMRLINPCSASFLNFPFHINKKNRLENTAVVNKTILKTDNSKNIIMLELINPIAAIKQRIAQSVLRNFKLIKFLNNHDPSGQVIPGWSSNLRRLCPAYKR